MHQLGPVGEAPSHIWHLTNHQQQALLATGDTLDHTVDGEEQTVLREGGAV